MEEFYRLKDRKGNEEPQNIVRTVLGLLLLVFAFAIAFFIIHFDNSNESFESMPKSFVKSFVMVLGEFGKNIFCFYFLSITEFIVFFF